MSEFIPKDKRSKSGVRRRKTQTDVPTVKREAARGVMQLQKQVGNRTVQRMILQRSGLPAAAGSFEVEDETRDRINQERGGGQTLDNSLRDQLEPSLGYDLTQVRVHTSPEADSLNQKLGARAFTTGNDIFFRDGRYDPHTSAGQELVTHEVAHVVQQNTGQVSGSGSMKVNEPGDSFEQKADDIARQASLGKPAALSANDGLSRPVQRQELPAVEEEELKKKEDESVEYNA